MQSEEQKSWEIKVHAKAKRFSLKLKATKLSPTWRDHKIHFLLKIHKFFFILNSQSKPSNHSNVTIKSKLLRIADKIRSIATKRASNYTKPKAKNSINRLRIFVEEDPFCFGSLLSGILGFVLQNGVFFKFALVVLMFIAFLIKKCEARKIIKLLVFLVATSFACFSMVSKFNNYNCTRYVENYTAKYLWRVWKSFGLGAIWDIW